MVVHTFFPIFRWSTIRTILAAAKDAAAPTVGILISVLIPFMARLPAAKGAIAL